jgi:hypothetical protein
MIARLIFANHGEYSVLNVLRGLADPARYLFWVKAVGLAMIAYCS